MPATLPEIHGSYFDAESHSELVIEWVAKYIKLYDNKEDRVKLMDVYDDKASFSMSAVIPGDKKKMLSELFTVFVFCCLLLVPHCRMLSSIAL